MKQQPWMLLAGFVVGLWVVALVAIHFVQAQVPTAASVNTWIERQDWASLTSEEREQRLEALADRMNHLRFGERQKLQADHALEPVIRQMTEGERLHFMDLTLPKG